MQAGGQTPVFVMSTFGLLSAVCLSHAAPLETPRRNGSPVEKLRSRISRRRRCVVLVLMLELLPSLTWTRQDRGRCYQDMSGPKSHVEDDSGSDGWYSVRMLLSSLLIVAEKHQISSLTNDGNAILREIDVAHPAAKNMIELSRTQDEECGDGTTSVIILGALLLLLPLTCRYKYQAPNPFCSGRNSRTARLTTRAPH